MVVKTLYTLVSSGTEARVLADHTFALPLKRDHNVLSARILSGSGRWKLEFGGPKERELAFSAGTDPDRSEVSLVADGKILSRQIVSLQLDAPKKPPARLKP